MRVCFHFSTDGVNGVEAFCKTDDYNSTTALVVGVVVRRSGRFLAALITIFRIEAGSIFWSPFVCHCDDNWRMDLFTLLNNGSLQRTRRPKPPLTAPKTRDHLTRNISKTCFDSSGHVRTNTILIIWGCIEQTICQGMICANNSRSLDIPLLFRNKYEIIHLGAMFFLFDTAH